MKLELIQAQPGAELIYSAIRRAISAGPDLPDCLQ